MLLCGESHHPNGELQWSFSPRRRASKRVLHGSSQVLTFLKIELAPNVKQKRRKLCPTCFVIYPHLPQVCPLPSELYLLERGFGSPLTVLFIHLPLMNVWWVRRRAFLPRGGDFVPSWINGKGLLCGSVSQLGALGSCVSVPLCFTEFPAFRVLFLGSPEAADKQQKLALTPQPTGNTFCLFFIRIAGFLCPKQKQRKEDESIIRWTHWCTFSLIYIPIS